MSLEDLNRGNKREFHLMLYEDELEVLDGLARQYNCSRSAIVGAWVKEYAKKDLTGKVASGRRPGGGRKAQKGTDT